MYQFQNVPPYAQVVFIDDEEKDYSKEKFNPTMTAKQHNKDILTEAETRHAASQKEIIDLKASNAELIDKLNALQAQVDALAAQSASKSDDSKKNK